MSNVPGKPVLSRCGTQTENASEFFNYHLKPEIQKGKPYIKDSGDFINKTKSCKIFLIEKS